MLGSTNVHAKTVSYMKVEHFNIVEWIGTNPWDPDIHKSYVSDKITDPVERDRELKSLPKVEAADKLEKRGVTVFFRRPEDGQLYIKNHMIKGYLKAAGDAIRIARKLDPEASTGKGKGTKWGSISSKVDEHVTIDPIELIVHGKDGLPKTDADGLLVRSLRGETPQGPRVTIVKSEYLEPLSMISYTIYWRDGGPVTRDMIVDMMDQGEVFFGIGQWRNSGKGKFTWRIVEEGKGIPESEPMKQLTARLAAKK